MPGHSFPLRALLSVLFITSLATAAPASSEPIEPQATIAVPDLSLDPASLDFGSVFIGHPTSLTVTVTNTGDALLSVSSTAFGLPDYSVDVPAFDLEPLASRDVLVTFNPVSPGDRSSQLVFTSNDPDSPHSLPLSASGTVAPVASVLPTSLSSNLLSGETETRQLQITNTGGSDLVFSIASRLTGSPVAAYESRDLLKGEADLEPGILGSGGPDAFGYSWIDSDEIGGPAFDWTDISTTGTPVFTGFSDDGNRGPFPIGFAFPFYGTDFNEFRVCSNGWISFTSTSTDFSNSPLPGTGAPENLLALFHDDLKIDPAGDGSNVYYAYDGSRLIVQFDKVYRLGSGGPYTFQALLYPTGAIVYKYLSMLGTRLDEATIGIQNASRTDGLTVVYNDTYVHDGLAIHFASQPRWLSTSPASGIVPPGGSIPVDVTFDATGLLGGSYDGALLVQTNDPANSLIEVAAHLDVTGVPTIALAPASLDFGDVFVGYPATLNLVVSNSGTDLLSVASITADLPDYAVDVASFDLNPTESRVLTVTFDPQAAGDRGGQLTFTSNDPAAPHFVPLAGNGVHAPAISLSPDPVAGAALPGGSTTKTLTVCNTGLSDLVFSVIGREGGATALRTSPENASNPTVHGELSLPKQADEPGSVEAVDPRPAILGAGGPDLFGYAWTDSDDPGGPVYDWVDISAVGTPVPFDAYADDGNVGPVPIGFTFPFYGATFSEIYACSNGWLSFTNSTLRTYTNQPLPNSGSSVPENLLAPWWDDMVYDESDGNSAYYYNDGSRFIVQFHIRRIAAFTPPFYEFQVILYPDGNIVYQYRTLGPNTSSCTIGIQNGAKDDGLTVVHNNGAYPHEDLAIRFSAVPDWLTVAPTSGVLPAGECVDLEVRMDATELAAGDYLGSLVVTSNDPGNPVASVGAVFHVGSIDAAFFEIGNNTLNLGSNGKWITAYVELPEGYAPEDVVVETVRLNGVVPADVRHYDIGDVNENGFRDLTFKFDRRAVAAILPEGESVAITVTGEIRDMTYFTGTDHIRVIRPQMNHPNGGELLVTGSTTEIAWTNPDRWRVTSATLTWSPDGGETWHLIAEGVTGTRHTWQVPEETAPDALVRVLIYDDEGLMGFDSSDEAFAIVSGIADVAQPVPAEFGVTFASANPIVRGSAVIELALPREGVVSVGVYDVRGALVRDLAADRFMAAGRHRLEWDRTNRLGVPVSSGVYFLRAHAGGKEVRTRLTVMR